MKRTSKLARKILAAVAIHTMFAGQGLPALAQSLDLSSTAKTAVAPSSISSSVFIRTGSHAQQVMAGTALTPAQALAVNQVMQTGNQALVLGAQGNAIGGHALLNSSLANVTSLLVPQNVQILRDFAGAADLNVSGNFINSGKFFAVSTNPASSDAAISARSIINNAGGLISSINPTGALHVDNAIDRLNLSLTSATQIVNKGEITSSGALNLVAGTGLTNSGTLAAVGDIRVAQNVNSNGNFFADLNGGKISSLTGDVNFDFSNMTANQNLAIAGGDINARALNINAGQGTVGAILNSVNAPINVAAACANVGALNGAVQLGNVSVSGDPTFFSNGDLTITDDITSQDRLNLLAAGNVILGGHKFDSGGNAVVVVAGAQLVIKAGDISYPTPISSGDSVTVKGASVLGGNITCSSCNFRTQGGSLTFVAFKGIGAGAAGGGIDLASGVVDTSNEGAAGGVKIIGPGAISLPKTTMNGSGGAQLIVATAQPVGAFTARGGGAASSGDFKPGKTTGGTIELNNPIVGNRASISLTSGGNLTVGAAGSVNVSGGNSGEAGGKLTLNSGADLSLSSNIEANGANGSVGLFTNGKNGAGTNGGAGGTISINAVGTISYPGNDMPTIKANGGKGGDGSGGLVFELLGGASNGIAGGAGGAGGKGGSVTFSAHNVSLARYSSYAIGGAGGNGTQGTDGGAGKAGGVGGRGGDGAQGGAISVKSDDDNVMAVWDSHGGDAGSGGHGGNGGNNAAGTGGAGADGGAGGAGGKGGTITQTSSTEVGSAEFHSQGGHGGEGAEAGNGGSGKSGGRGGDGGTSGVGGNGGKIIVTGPMQVAANRVDDFGGDGGNAAGHGGAGGEALDDRGVGGHGGNAGSAGRGGNGGTETLSSTLHSNQESVAGFLDDHGGNAGRSAAHGGAGGANTGNGRGGDGGNGSTGASGGNGGKITINATGSTKVGSMTITARGGDGSVASATSGDDNPDGGAGGNGGNGGGRGGSSGSGGSGGNGGTVNIASFVVQLSRVDGSGGDGGSGLFRGGNGGASGGKLNGGDGGSQLAGGHGGNGGHLHLSAKNDLFTGDDVTTNGGKGSEALDDNSAGKLSGGGKGGDSTSGFRGNGGTGGRGGNGGKAGQIELESVEGQVSTNGHVESHGGNGGKGTIGGHTGDDGFENEVGDDHPGGRHGGGGGSGGNAGAGGRIKIDDNIPGQLSNQPNVSAGTRGNGAEGGDDVGGGKGRRGDDGALGRDGSAEIHHHGPVAFRALDASEEIVLDTDFEAVNP